MLSSLGGEKVIKIIFPESTHTLYRVLRLTGRLWHKDGDFWTAPLFVGSLKSLKRWGFELDDTLTRMLKRYKRKKEVYKHPDGIPGLQGKLYPFQADGVAFIEANDGRALVGDEMGLGKTIQALAWLQLHPEHRPAIVVVPASIKWNWMKEAETWMSDPKVEVLSGSDTWKPNGEILIINYAVLHEWVSVLLSLDPKVLVTDECHYYKNNRARRTRAVKKLSKQIPHVIALSGTPIVNRPIEVYNPAHIIYPQMFKSFRDFVVRYCNAKFTPQGWNYTGSSHKEELHRLLSTSIMIRRLKSKVLKELPDKVYSFVPIEMTNERQYNAAESAFVRAVSESQTMVAYRSHIETLKQSAVRNKMKACKDWIRDFISTEGKLVVFAMHRFVVDELMKEFGECAVKIDGRVSAKDRQEAVTKFQEDESVRLFVGNIKAAGVGITLTASSAVAFIELPWSPGELVQAIDRCHRIGQKDTVNVYYLLAKDTIEEKIAKIIDRKSKVVGLILDGKEPERETLLIEIMKEYKTKTKWYQKSNK